MKNDNFTVENEGIVENGTDFIILKLFTTGIQHKGISQGFCKNYH